MLKVNKKYIVFSLQVLAPPAGAPDQLIQDKL